MGESLDIGKIDFITLLNITKVKINPGLKILKEFGVSKLNQASFYKYGGIETLHIVKKNLCNSSGIVVH